MALRRFSSTSIDTTLAAYINSAATSMTVVSGTGAPLMGGITLNPGDQFTVTIDTDTINEEVVFITARTTDTFTITRGCAGSSAVSHASGARVTHSLTSDDLNYFNQAIISTTAPGSTPTIDGGTP